MKQRIMSKLAAQLRDFRRRLARKYILPFKDDPEALSQVPKEYKLIIDQKCWDAFVKYRLSDAFKVRECTSYFFLHRFYVYYFLVQHIDKDSFFCATRKNPKKQKSQYLIPNTHISLDEEDTQAWQRNW